MRLGLIKKPMKLNFGLNPKNNLAVCDLPTQYYDHQIIMLVKIKPD